MRILFFISILLISLNGKAQVDMAVNFEFALIEANRQKSIGNLNEALNLYRKCLQVKPESGIAAFELGNIYMSLNDPDKAFEYLEKAYLSDPDNYWYMLSYLEILRVKEKYDVAEEVIMPYLEKKDDPKIRYFLAGIYDVKGKYKKALKHLKIIESSKGLSESVVLRRAEIYKKQKKLKKGEEELLRLIELMPERPDYYILLAEYLNNNGSKAKAAGYFLEAYKLDSTNLYAITNLADFNIQNNNFAVGFSYLNKAYSDPQIELENKLKTLFYYLEEPQFLKAYSVEIEGLVMALLDLYPNENIVLRVAYDFYFKVQNFDKAFVYIKRILEIESDNYSLWQQAIYNASLLGLNDEMIELGNEATKIFPNKTDLYLFIGIGHYQNNDFQNAYDILKENYVLGLDNNVQLQFLTFLGESAFKLGYTDESFIYFEELILLDPENLPILNNYSYYLSLEEINLERAEILSYKTIQKEPESTIYLDTYGWILFKLNRFEEAIKYLEKASLTSNDPDVLFHFAEALYKNENKDKACEYYKKALEAGYDEESVNAKLMLCQ